MSTVDGPNRFDGNEVRCYGFEDGLLDKNVQGSFFEDEQSNIWFTTPSTLNCYVRKQDTILNYRLKDEDGQPILEEYKAFYLDTLQQHLWLRAGDYIWRLHVNNPKTYYKLPITTNGFHFLVESNEQGKPQKIIASPWLNGEGIQHFAVEDSIVIEFYELFCDLAPCKTISLNDSLYLIFSKNKLIQFNLEEPSNYSFLNNTESVVVKDALKFDEAHLLLATEKNELCLYNWQTQSLVKNWKNKENNPNSLSSKKPRYLNKTNNDFIWVSGIKMGLDYSCLNSNPFENATTDFGIGEIRFINQLADGSIWVGSKDKKIIQFNPNGEIKHTIDVANYIENTGISWGYINLEDGPILMTVANSIYQISNFDKLKIKTIIDSPGLIFHFLNNVFSDQLLVSTTEGIKELYKDKEGDYQIKPFKGLEECQELKCLKLFQTNKNQLYVSYNASEFWVYEADYNGLKAVSKIDCGLDIFSFFKSKKHHNTVWAGTSNGVIKIINDTIIEPAFKEVNELSRGRVYGVVEDLNGDLWVGTNKGLWRYSEDPSKPRFSQFEVEDGLPSNQFAQYNSSLLASDGSVWMGTNKGVVHFDPNEIKIPYNPPNVYLSKLIINDTEEYKGIGEEREIALPYNQNTLTFEALAISFLKPEKSKIHYRLKGYDKEYLQIKPEQRIRYTKLPHGNYALEIQAENAYGQRSNTHSLSIKINPPFWKTWWFMSLCLVLASILAYAFYRFRLKQLLKEEEQKTILAKLETQVLEVEMKALKAQMNPHFLFNAMNSIKGIMLDKDEEKASEYLTKFSLLLRSILEHSEKQVIPLIKELEALDLYIAIESLRFEKNFHYKISIDKNVDTGFSEIPPLILQPFVENAIWHGLLPKEKGELLLNIRIKRDEDFLIIEIEDNGVGRNYATKKTTSQKHKSFGIDITKRRAELLNSENKIKIIDLISPEGQPLGTNVILSLNDPE